MTGQSRKLADCTDGLSQFCADVDVCIDNGVDVNVDQGGRTWQPFVGSKNGNENFRQARIYNFRVKCVVFARNRKFAKLTQ